MYKACNLSSKYEFTIFYHTANTDAPLGNSDVRVTWINIKKDEAANFDLELASPVLIALIQNRKN